MTEERVSKHGASWLHWPGLAAALETPDRWAGSVDCLPLEGGSEEGGDSGRQRRETLVAVLADLHACGWRFRLESDQLFGTPPQAVPDREAERARIRAQLELDRADQVRLPSVQQFLNQLEAPRLHQGRLCSVVGLMRDGRSLARGLQEVAAGHRKLEDLIQPYVQIVEGEARCEKTGFLLRDIWRYFRHTWSSPYRSSPGRGLMVLVRDAATRDHAVIGLGLLASVTSQSRARDSWIGWEPRQVLEALRRDPKAARGRWLQVQLASELNNLYVQDFLEDGLLAPGELVHPTVRTLSRLREEARLRRAVHSRAAESGLKVLGLARPSAWVDAEEPSLELPETGVDWEAQARLPLYRSKRAELLAELLWARDVVERGLPDGWGELELRRLVRSKEGGKAVRFLARRAKARVMGTALAELAVCGAIAPYSHILCGKLVSMLLCGLEVRQAWRRRYAQVESLIASAMAGRAVRRGAEVVLMTTSSLYGVPLNQYTRLGVPAVRLRGLPGERLGFIRVGYSRGFGTTQFSARTVQALGCLVSRDGEGMKLTSNMGEGSSPRLRKVREGLELLGLRSELLLQHGSPRVLYAVPLARNACAWLRGEAEAPEWLVPEGEGAEDTRGLVSWWWERWGRARSEREEVLRQVEGERVSYPLQHGARVVR